MEFCDWVDDVYDTVHAPDDKLQEVEPNIPPPPPSLHDTEPVGVVG
jgi:hypothetical protein